MKKLREAREKGPTSTLERFFLIKDVIRNGQFGFGNGKIVCIQ